MRECKNNRIEPSWAAFKNELDYNYNDMESTSEVRNKLHKINISQFKTLNEYNEKFLEFINILGDLNDEQSIPLYNIGLQEVKQIHDKLVFINPKTLKKQCE